MSCPSLSLCELFQAAAAVRGDAPALTMADHPGYTWTEYADAVRRLAPGFAGLGVTRGQPVAILTRPRPEFHVIDTALLHAGAVPFSLQEGDPAEQLARNLQSADVRVLVTEQLLLPQARRAAEEYGGVEALVCVDGPVPDGVLAQVDVETHRGPDFDELWQSVAPDDVATLIFTSGTTGVPKGVQLSHRAIAASQHSTHALAPFVNPGTVLSYLPLGHIAERFMSHYASIAYGVTVRSVPEPDTLYDEIRNVRPVRFFGVPRVYEKLVDRARAVIAADSALGEALAATLIRVRAEQAGRPVTSAEERAAAAGHAALAGVRRAMGLDRAEHLGVATAPSSYPMLETLLGLGLRVSDIWGLSEAIMCTLNPPGAIRLGTVGRFLDGVEGRIADDGEILVRGPNTFSGYLGDPARTAETRGPGGWVHTGDVGSIEDGYLTIRGRKKELLITATGKNIAPAAIEGAIKSASSLIDHVVAIADGRRYVTALIALDAEQLVGYAREHGLPGDFATLTRLHQVRATVADAVRAGNARLSRAEAVRAFHIVDHEWRPGDDELTPTAKLRRHEITRKYATEIEDLYS